jgi:hypothetical protein
MIEMKLLIRPSIAVCEEKPLGITERLFTGKIKKEPDARKATGLPNKILP